MSHWASQLNMTHTLTTYDTSCYKLTIFINSSFARTNALEFGIVRANILNGTKDSLTEQTIAFWLLSSIVNSFGLSDFTIAPSQNVFRTGYSKSHSVEISNVGSRYVMTHLSLLFL